MIELDAFGLGAVWLRVAEVVGYDAFVDLWRKLSSDDAVRTTDGRIVLELRGFHWYEDMQRRQYIRRLVALGFGVREIYDLVRSHLRHDCTKRSVKNDVEACRKADAGRAKPLGLTPFMVSRIRDSVAGQVVSDLFPDRLESALQAAACRASAPRRQKVGMVSDPRIAEFAAMGLSQTWMGVARLVGYDAFVQIWAEWWSDDALRGGHGRIELHLRQFSTFERYQRNRYIETLVQCGLAPSKIQAMVAQHIGESLTVRHIKRLIVASKMGKP